ncbi:MAB_1171c family putative transporter [Streptomyces sp. NPDC046887]|uniref:MAB_1171c family putative transporter n=1 Tax=Streptomyces sp. NPDC046887 TaxID=3155472 RepID=UPI0033F9F203
MFQIPLIVLLALGVLWKAVDLARSPYDRALRSLVLCLLLLLTGEVLSFPEVTAAIDEATTAGTGKVAYNAIYLSGLYVLVSFFVSCAGLPDATTRRYRRIDTALLAGVLIALTAAMIATPAGMRAHSLSTPHMAEPPIAFFYILGNAYFVYAYAACALYALRFAGTVSRPLALGLRTMALGLLGLTATALGRLVLVVLRIDTPGAHQSFNTVNWSVANWSMGVVLVGTCYSAAVHLGSRWRSAAHHRRMYRELTPLWTALAAAYPEIVLVRNRTGPPWHRLRSSPQQRFYRRLIECRDGLLRLSPQLRRLAPDEDLAGGPPDHVARLIATALHLRQSTDAPAPGIELPATPVASPSPAETGLDADARELLAISRAFHTISPAPSPSLRERKA